MDGAAFGPRAVASAARATAIGADSVADQPNTVSVGSSGAERRITNVAPGIAGTDAVNLAQLGSAQIEARRGIAAALALNNAVTPSAPGRTTLAVGAGFFHGENGVGVSFAHRLNTMMPIIIQGGFANGGGDENAGRVGVAVEF